MYFIKVKPHEKDNILQHPQNEKIELKTFKFDLNKTSVFVYICVNLSSY